MNAPMNYLLPAKTPHPPIGEQGSPLSRYLYFGHGNTDNRRSSRWSFSLRQIQGVIWFSSVDLSVIDACVHRIRGVNAVFLIKYTVKGCPHPFREFQFQQFRVWQTKDWPPYRCQNARLQNNDFRHRVGIRFYGLGYSRHRCVFAVPHPKAEIQALAGFWHLPLWTSIYPVKVHLNSGVLRNAPNVELHPDTMEQAHFLKHHLVTQPAVAESEIIGVAPFSGEELTRLYVVGRFKNSGVGPCLLHYAKLSGVRTALILSANVRLKTFFVHRGWSAGKETPTKSGAGVVRKSCHALWGPASKKNS